VGAALLEREFAVAVDREGPRLYALALSILGDAHEAEDAVQDTMVQAWRDWTSLHDPARRGAWLATICLRTCLRLRRRLRARWHHAPIAAEQADTRVVAGTDIDLVQACRRLSPQQRSVVALHYVYGFSLDECAQVMGCGAGTVRPHLHRALAKLREAYAND
jgi:RNA polymerase sigma-70 factor (ECF subfamily)